MEAKNWSRENTEKAIGIFVDVLQEFGMDKVNVDMLSSANFLNHCDLEIRSSAFLRF